LDQADKFVKESERSRYSLRSSGRVNPLPSTKAQFKKACKMCDYSKTTGIEESEIGRRKSSGVSLRCAWPSEKYGTHRVKDCISPIKLDEGTANCPKVKPLEKKINSDSHSCSEEEVS